MFVSLGKNNYCVYMHVSPSKKYYIGITSLNVNKRWRQGKGYKLHPYFYCAIQKYGWNNFKHIILYNHLSKEEACKTEVYLISKYKSNDRRYGYNLSVGGESGSAGCHFIMSQEHKAKIGIAHIGKSRPKETCEKISRSHVGHKCSEATKEKLRLISTGRKQTEATKQKISQKHKGKKKIYVGNYNKLLKSKIVYQFDIYGDFIKEYPSAREAAREIGIAESGISKCCQRKGLSYKSYIWRYAEEIKDYKLDVSNETLLKIQKSNRNKFVQQYTVDMKLINTYKSCREASSKTGYSNSGISKCCAGEFKQLRNYIWRYVDHVDKST